MIDSQKQLRFYNQDKDIVKLIASTNKLPLEPYQGHFEGVDCTNYLPQLSEQAIKLLIEYYNENGEMPEWVKVIEQCSGGVLKPRCLNRIKLKKGYGYFRNFR